MAISTKVQSASQAARDEVRTLANAHALLSANACAAAAGCAIATTTTQAKTVNSVAYKLDGAYQSAKAGTDNLWTLAGTTVPVSSFQKYYLLIGSGGTASVMQGVPASTAAGVTLPFPPQSQSIFGVLTVATDATHPFVPGTTALNATGITATFVDGIDPSTLTLVVLG